MVLLLLLLLFLRQLVTRAELSGRKTDLFTYVGRTGVGRDYRWGQRLQVETPIKRPFP